MHHACARAVDSLDKLCQLYCWNSKKQGLYACDVWPETEVIRTNNPGLRLLCLSISDYGSKPYRILIAPLVSWRYEQIICMQVSKIVCFGLDLTLCSDVGKVFLLSQEHNTSPTLLLRNGSQSCWMALLMAILCYSAGRVEYLQYFSALADHIQHSGSIRHSMTTRDMSEDAELPEDVARAWSYECHACMFCSTLSVAVVAVVRLTVFQLPRSWCFIPMARSDHQIKVQYRVCPLHIKTINHGYYESTKL